MRRRRSPKKAREAPESHEDLPRAELEVLACLWQKGKATAREVREAMSDYRPMSHGSMVTLLNRLESKDLVSKEKAPVGKAFVFQPTRGPERTYRRIMGDLHDHVFGGNRLSMVASLFETRTPTPDEVDALQDLLVELRAKQGK